jgi:hypothetical protein
MDSRPARYLSRCSPADECQRPAAHPRRRKERGRALRSLRLQRVSAARGGAAGVRGARVRAANEDRPSARIRAASTRRGSGYSTGTGRPRILRPRPTSRPRTTDNPNQQAMPIRMGSAVATTSSPDRVPRTRSSAGRPPSRGTLRLTRASRRCFGVHPPTWLAFPRTSRPVSLQHRRRCFAGPSQRVAPCDPRCRYREGRCPGLS